MANEIIEFIDSQEIIEITEQSRDALSVWGRQFDSAAPANDEVMAWDSGTSKWTPKAVDELAGGFVNVTGDTMTGDLTMQTADILASGTPGSIGATGSRFAAAWLDALTVTNIAAVGILEVGTSPAAAGAIRLPNNNSIRFRNAANSADINTLSVNASDQVELLGGNVVVSTANTTVLQELIVSGTGASSYAGNLNIASAKVLNLDGTDDGNNAFQYFSGTHMRMISKGQETFRADATSMSIGASVAFSVTSTSTLTDTVGIGTAPVVLNALKMDLALADATASSQTMHSLGGTFYTTGTMRGLHIIPGLQAGVAGGQYVGIAINELTFGAGATASTAIGLNIADMTAASSTNKAIVTGLGAVEFGDTLAVTGVTTHSNHVKLDATRGLYFDNGTDHTFIAETSNDVLGFTVGSVLGLTLTEATSVVTAAFTGPITVASDMTVTNGNVQLNRNSTGTAVTITQSGTGAALAVVGGSLAVDATEKIFLNGATATTYFYEQSASNAALVVGNTLTLEVSTSAFGIRNTDVTIGDNKSLTVTGALSSSTSMIATIASDAVTTILGARNTSTGVSAVNRFAFGNDSSVNAVTFDVFGSLHSTKPNKLEIFNQHAAALALGTNGVAALTIDSSQVVTFGNDIHIGSGHIIDGNTNSSLIISGGSTKDLGMNLVLYGEAAGASNDFRFRNATTNVFDYEDTAALFTMVGVLVVDVLGAGVTAGLDASTVASFNRNSTTGLGAQVSIIAGNAASSILALGDAEDEDVGAVSYSHATNVMGFRVNGATDVTIGSGGDLSMGDTLTIGADTVLSRTAPNELSLANGDSFVIVGGNFTVGGGGGVTGGKGTFNSLTDNVAARFQSSDATCEISLEDNTTTGEGYVGIRATGDVLSFIALGSVSGNFTGDNFTANGSVTAGGQMLGKVGSATSPSFAITGDTHTGLYAVSGDVIGVTTAGVLRAQFKVSSLTLSNGYSLIIDAGDKLFLDGGSDTYIYEASANNMLLVTGGSVGLTVHTNAVSIPATNPLYLDGGSDTYIYESAANQIRIMTGGVMGLWVDASQNVSIKATAKLYLDGGSDTYLSETTANHISVMIANIDEFSVFVGGATLKATGKLYLDGGNDTYIYESVGNTISFYTNGTRSLAIGPSYIFLEATDKLYLDGGNDTYIFEGAANDFRVVVGGVLLAQVTPTEWSCPQDLSIAATKRLYLDGSGDTYIYESSGNNMAAVVGGTTIWAATTTDFRVASTIDLVVVDGNINVADTDLGDGAAGHFVDIGGNTNVTNGGAGFLKLTDLTGTILRTWVDGSGDFRIHSADPTTANDAAGTVVGTQTSWWKTKVNISRLTARAAVLRRLLDVDMWTFQFREDGQRLDKVLTGYVIHERGSWWSMNDQENQTPVLDEANILGHLTVGVQMVHEITQDHEVKITDLAKRLAELENERDELTARVRDLEEERAA